MRIALVHYSAPPVIGGVERVLAQQAAILAKFGHDVVVVAGNKGARVDGACMEYAPNFYVKRVRSALAGSELVLVHNMFTMPFNWEASQMLAELSQEMTAARFINWVHDVDVSPEAFAALPLRATNVAVSEVRRLEFQAVAGETSRCVMVPNGLDVSQTLGFSPRVATFVEENDLLGRDLILFHPTRVLARKNLELGIEVTAALKKMGLNVAYIVTGAPDPYRPESGDYAAHINALIEEKGVQDHFLFAGKAGLVPEEDVRSFYGLADALFFPSKKEGFGLPLLEAKLHRLPIFCSEIPIHREVMAETVTFFGLDQEPAAIAALIWQQLQDDAVWKSRRASMARFSWTRIYKDYLEPLLNES